MTPWRRTALHKTAGVFSQRELTHVGLDVHRDSISVAILKPVDETPIAKRIFHDEASIRKLVGSFPDPSRVRACYEARPHRLRTPPTAPTAWGPLRRHRPVAHPEGARRPGEDRSSDARRLTLLHRAGQLVAIRVPAPEVDDHRGHRRRVPPGGAAAGLDTRAFPSGLAGARTGVDDSCAQAQSGERGRGGTASGSRGWRPICPHSPALST